MGWRYNHPTPVGEGEQLDKSIKLMAAQEHYSYEDDYLPPATDDLVGPWEVTDNKDISIGKKKKLRKG